MVETYETCNLILDRKIKALIERAFIAFKRIIVFLLKTEIKKSTK